MEDEEPQAHRKQKFGVGEEINLVQRVYVNGVLFNGILATDIITDPYTSLDKLAKGEAEGVEITIAFSLIHNNGARYKIHPREIRSIVNTRGHIFYVEL